jgi:hypothetical protein
MAYNAYPGNDQGTMLHAMHFALYDEQNLGVGFTNAMQGLFSTVNNGISGNSVPQVDQVLAEAIQGTRLGPQGAAELQSAYQFLWNKFPGNDLGVSQECFADAYRVAQMGPGSAARFEQLYNSYYNSLPGTDIGTIRTAVNDALSAMGAWGQAPGPYPIPWNY